MSRKSRSVHLEPAGFVGDISDPFVIRRKRSGEYVTAGRRCHKRLVVGTPHSERRALDFAGGAENVSTVEDKPPIATPGANEHVPGGLAIGGLSSTVLTFSAPPAKSRARRSLWGVPTTKRLWQRRPAVTYSPDLFLLMTNGSLMSPTKPAGSRCTLRLFRLMSANGSYRPEESIVRSRRSGRARARKQKSFSGTCNRI